MQLQPVTSSLAISPPLSLSLSLSLILSRQREQTFDGRGIRSCASVRLQPRARQLFDLVSLGIRVQLDPRPCNSHSFSSLRGNVEVSWILIYHVGRALDSPSVSINCYLRFEDVPSNFETLRFTVPTTRNNIEPTFDSLH